MKNSSGKNSCQSWIGLTPKVQNTSRIVDSGLTAVTRIIGISENILLSVSVIGISAIT